MEKSAEQGAFPLPRPRQANGRLHTMVPGGAHTYAKGDDQYPEDLAPVISHGRGAHVWDVDGNRYVVYGSGLRSVSLGHAHPRVRGAVRKLSRPASRASRTEEYRRWIESVMSSAIGRGDSVTHQYIIGKLTINVRLTYFACRDDARSTGGGCCIMAPGARPRRSIHWPQDENAPL